MLSRLFLVTLLCAGLACPLQATASGEKTDENGAVSEGLMARTKPMLYALTLIGSPYKRGGTDPNKGVDCSGFVRHVYNDASGLELPHNALQMSREGVAVEKMALEPGDLVFFNTRRKPFSHVGIYLGEGRFVHSSSTRSKYVTVSNLDDRYWTTRYNGARRIHPERLKSSL
ncbi:MAG: C40 family peptidase [Betaproteobacteria bacterium]|nr:C40 family peptidase [Betaproteobacteria bacterium]